MPSQRSGYTTITQDHTDLISTQANTASSLTEILEIQTPQGSRFVYPSDRPIEFFLMTHEQFTTDATGSNQETFSLSNELTDSPALAGDGGADGEDTSPPSSGQADLVLYDDGTQVAPDNVRYTSHATNPNQFDYTDSGTASTLDVYYVWQDSGSVVGRYYQANEEGYDEVFGTTPGVMHNSATYHANEEITFRNQFSAGPKEKLKFFLNSAVDVTNWDSFNSDGPNSTTSYSSFRIPVVAQQAPDRSPRRRGVGRGPR